MLGTADIDKENQHVNLAATTSATKALATVSATSTMTAADPAPLTLRLGKVQTWIFDCLKFLPMHERSLFTGVSKTYGELRFDGFFHKFLCLCIAEESRLYIAHDLYDCTGGGPVYILCIP